MYNYMKALYCRFTDIPEQILDMEHAVDQMHRQLSDRLGKAEKKLLLRLVDKEDELRDKACLNSFVSGYRLAQGIQQELLAGAPPYSFEKEDEQRACRLLRQSLAEKDTE